jgi:hypothetical protein
MASLDRPGGYAVCGKHVEDAINWGVHRKLPLRIRVVAGKDGYGCSCREPADYYLYEVLPEPAPARDVLDLD